MKVELEQDACNSLKLTLDGKAWSICDPSSDDLSEEDLNLWGQIAFLLKREYPEASPVKKKAKK